MGLYKRGNVWWGRFKENGTTRRVRLDTDKRFAQDKLSDLVKARNAGKYGREAPGMALEPFWTRYRAWVSENKTYARVQEEQRSWDALGAAMPHVRRIEQITPSLLDDLRIEWKRRGVTPASIHRHTSTIKVIMRRAEVWKLVEPHIWSVVANPSTYRPKVIFWTKQELERILAKANSLWKTAFALGARAGLRPGESYHLQPQNLDLKNGTLRVTGKPCDCYLCDREDGRWEPKSERSNRTIPIPVDLLEHLRGVDLSGKWVLRNTKGQRPGRQLFNVYPPKILKSLKLPGSMHTARHTFASHLVQDGADLIKVRDLLGHTTIKQTEIYAHLAPHSLVETIALLPEVGPY